MAPSVFDFTVWKLLYATPQAPRVLRRVLYLWKASCIRAEGYVCLSYLRVLCSTCLWCTKHLLCDTTTVNCISSMTGCVPECLFVCLFVCFGATTPQWSRASSFTRFLDHTQRRTTVGRTPLDEWSACRRDLYLTTDRHPCPRWDWNPQSQPVSGRRPTP